jgi:choline dehydrogenase-like flavoprotein
MNDFLTHNITPAYDAIVIGTGISGGWAAKELCEHGLKTLVLDRGRNIEHIKDYTTAKMNPWDFDHRGIATIEQKRIYGQDIKESDIFLMNENEQTYIQEKPFKWTRGHQVGGRSLVWARQTQRWSDFDFTGPLRDGFGVDWPIRYNDIAPWYSHVEKFVGISGNKDGLDNLPDGDFLPPIEMNRVESHFRNTIVQNYNDRHLIHGRCAHITDPTDIHLQQGRGKCMHRTRCDRGCPIGGYFSSNSSTLPWAQKTGNLTLRPHSVVQAIIYDDNLKQAIGVQVIDSISKKPFRFYAKIIFLNASTLNTNLILLNSVSERFPNGLGNDNGMLGKNIMWHNYRGQIKATFDQMLDKPPIGRKSNPSYIPRFRNIIEQETDFLRGYAVGFTAGLNSLNNQNGLGEQLKNNLLKKEKQEWQIKAWMMGEVIPLETNHVRLHPSLKDVFGIPQLVISCEWGKNEEIMIKDFLNEMETMFTRAGFNNITIEDTKSSPGSDIHEMGGVRMGNDPNTSLLNKWNHLHSCNNVFVTDGAAMTSSSTQNPSLTYMALTARAANYAISNFSK